MTVDVAFEQTLATAFESLTGSQTPPRLREAMAHAILPGSRVRPRLVYEVAHACGTQASAALDAAAVAVELLHCASLVHDDLPCFDDAPMRRGRPSVHVRFGEPLAVLVGDALIVGAFEILAEGCKDRPELLGPLLTAFTGGVGAARGIVAGQAWESEPNPDLRAYHRAKTAALFETAVSAGALVAGVPAARWRSLGLHIGEAYQIADDILDLVGSPHDMGKPQGRDQLHERPSAALELGLAGAQSRLRSLVNEMVTSVPPCVDRVGFQQWLARLCARLFPSLGEHELRTRNLVNDAASLPA